MSTSPPTLYPPIESYGFLSDGSACALVSRDGSIDWCCMPHMSDDPSFGRLLDWQRGGHCLLAPHPDTVVQTRRDYADDTLVLHTRHVTRTGRTELTDFLAAPPHRPVPHPRCLARRLRCTVGEIDAVIEVAPRFDFGEIMPSVDDCGATDGGLYTAYGSNKGLLICCDVPLAWCPDRQMLHARVPLKAGEQIRLSLRFVDPAELAPHAPAHPDRPDGVDRALRRTLAWWRTWARRNGDRHELDRQTHRSALIIKGLIHARTGAMAAAATTSLPETPGGERNWDYRYSWVRDSALAVRALHLLGFEHEAGRFNDFTERSAAGSAEQLQIMYGLDGKRRLSEICLDWLDGYRGARPVRVGNLAARQTQHDIYGSLLEVAAVWHSATQPIRPAYWSFLVSVVDLACQRWTEPDHGIWEFRDNPQHFVHSKVMCWVAIDRGLQLAARHGLQAPEARWREAAQAIRDEIDRRGYNTQAGHFVQAFDEPHLDAALLLLPHFGYIDACDPRMVRTTDAIHARLGRKGLLLRYDRADGLDEPEGAFLPCTFWLAECLALQGRKQEAQQVYRRALACANDLGLFSEEYAVSDGHMLGNFPQALTHLAQITARLVLDDMGEA
ncbi:glycoside hydrolase family 15 protein [Aquabacterium fontiphilum]|uniref:glycoside hydrolase family 15 protein n=1 Tax=Aquabacterium fontiphilum TaxID=450365 RepID=UPI001377BCC8|nr:glycoside hydrolase family 15 protein [Aquabacterium fontiphilum]NBD21028.1 glycoside hydrolase family 15 protein [Aquabacterium fontiphilum]